MSWLHYPGNLIRALLERIEQLEARDSLRRSAEVAVGSGSLEKASAERLQSEWERATSRRRPRPSLPEIRGAAAVMGIRIVSS